MSSTSNQQDCIEQRRQGTYPKTFFDDLDNAGDSSALAIKTSECLAPLAHQG
jgi:hypothetical protein